MDKIIDVALGILTELRPVPDDTDQPLGDQTEANTPNAAGSSDMGNDSQPSIKEALTTSNLATSNNENFADTELRILIARRPSHTVYGGYWELPGGKIEPGETPTQALVREFEEELGIKIEPGDPLDEVIHTYPHAKVRLYPFFCKRVSGRIQNIAVSEHQWVLPKDLKSFKFPEANLPIIKQIHRILHQNTTSVASNTP